MPLSADPHPHYGFSQHVFAFRKPNSTSLVIGGLSASRLRWTRVLSRRAAGCLWVYLAQMLEPTRVMPYIGLLDTSPMRESSLPTITSRVTVDALDEGGCEIVGQSGDQVWGVNMTDEHARLFWQALTLALHLHNEATPQSTAAQSQVQ